MNKKNIIILITVTVLLTFGVVIYILYTNKLHKYEYAAQNKTINGEEPKYNNPIIPKGFRAVDCETNWNHDKNIVHDWNKGLVIEDSSGNEFVWVPVEDGIEVDGIYTKDSLKYKKWHIYEDSEEIFSPDKEAIELVINEKITNSIISYKDLYEDILPKGVNNEYDQIKKYGGFYIARYEAGISEPDLKELYDLKDGYDFVCVSNLNNNTKYKPISKKNSQIWNFIEYKNAKIVSENMYSNENVQSGIMTGRQFDTIMSWAKKSGYNLEKANEWGNFADTINTEYKNRYASYLRKNSQDWKVKDYGIKEKENLIFTSSGSVEISKMNNIYDIAGNVFEFTSDLYKNKISMVRGGSAAYNGAIVTNHPVIGYSFGDSLHYVIGFRVVLYIK